MREHYHIGTTLSTEQWVDVLLDKEVSNDTNIAILQTMYSFEGYKIPASQIGLILGNKGKNTSSALNLEIGRWGKRLAKKFPVRFSVREDGSERKWDIFFDGWNEGNLFVWKIKDELVQALKITKLTGEEQLPEEISSNGDSVLTEGAKRSITVNAYERNSKARLMCIRHFGSTCQVCDFNFESVYGQIGKDYIHVHHLVKVADIGEEYEVNPITDLRPVCPNCHAMLHKKEPPYSIDELKDIISNNFDHQ
ncbi:HNH endonuclease [Cytophagaceae bacterium ABcell3]|nr:HNH endonuclease [Cytophagaceae bacterium ABcell3]